MRALPRRSAIGLMMVALACSSGDITSSLHNGEPSSSSSNIPATVVIAPPTSPNLTIGTSVALVVAVRDVIGQTLTSVAVVWTSSDTTVAIVSAAGVVSGRAIGIATITATAGGITATVTLNVMPVPVNAVSVVVPSAFFVGDSVAAVALAVDASGTVLTGRPVTWSSRNASIATVSSTGVVLGAGVGTTKIDAIVGGVTGTATVVVSVPPSSVASVAVAVGAPLVSIGQSTQAAATVKDSVGNVLVNRSVLWTSSNPFVATVSPLGVVTAVSLGNVIISASSGGMSGSAPLTVGSGSALPIATISVSAIVPTLRPGQASPAAAIPKDANGNVLVGPSFTWSSTDPTVATVSGSGVITGVAPGTVLITAASGGKTGGLSMQVGALTSQPPATVSVLANLANPDTLSPGDVVQAMATLRNASGTVVTTVAPTTFTSSNPGVASVNSIGIVSALSLGATTITARNSGTNGTAVITVIPPPVKTVTLSVGTTSLVSGRTTQATAVLRDTTNAVLTNRVIAWSHVTPAVATVDPNGLITAVGPGSGAIVATSEGRTATVFILVTMPPIANINIANPNVPLLLGQTAQLAMTILDVNGNQVPNASVVWSSNAPTKATVSQTGMVTAVGAGTMSSTVISVTTGTVTGTTTVTTIGHPVETMAALPQVLLNTTAPPAPDVGGAVINVNAGGNLQAAINAANPGDVIALANGAVFTGNFTLPNKNTSSTKWITIRPQNMTGIPPEGSRMTKTVAAAANLPVIRTTNGQGAISTTNSAHHYRFTGIEFTFFAPVSVENFGLVLFGDGGTGQNTTAVVPHDLVLDRVYVHGTATNEVRRCVTLNSASTAIIDSYLADCHESQSDSQGIMGWNGPGPFKIVNNYIEGASENILFGGSDPQIANLIPSDIEIRHNHITKPLSWNGGPWLIKNLFELKNSQRVLVEGNLMENNWANGQTGVAIALKSVNQNCTAAWQATTDVTFRYNLVRNVGGGMALAGAPDTCQVVTTHGRRFTVTDNVFTGINIGIFVGDGDVFQLHDDVTDVLLAHNTAFTPSRASVILFPVGPTVRVNIRDNVLGGGAYPILGSATAPGNGSISTYMPTGNVLANVIVVSSSASYPGTNFYPTTTAGIGVASLAGADYHLTAASAYKARATEGRDPGADIDTINTLLANIVVP